MTRNKLHTALGLYLVRNLGAEQPAGTSGADGPGVHVLWVGPDQVTEGPLVRNLLVAFNSADLVQGLDVRRQATVNAQDLLVYQLEGKNKLVAIVLLYLHLNIETILQSYC